MFRGDVCREVEEFWPECKVGLLVDKCAVLEDACSVPCLCVSCDFLAVDFNVVAVKDKAGGGCVRAAFGDCGDGKVFKCKRDAFAEAFVFARDVYFVCFADDGDGKVKGSVDVCTSSTCDARNFVSVVCAGVEVDVFDGLDVGEGDSFFPGKVGNGWGRAAANAMQKCFSE